METINEIVYDKEYEVSKKVYNILMTQYFGTCAGRTENNKFYIKVWMMNYADQILKIINTTK